MNPPAIAWAITLLGLAAVSAVLAIGIYKHFFEEPRYRAWAEQNGQKIADLEMKVASLQLKLNNFYGQLLALGLKLPGMQK